MKHFIKSDIVSMGPGVSYVVGEEKEDLKGDHVRIKKGKRDGLPVVRKTLYRGIPVSIQLDRGMKASGKDEDGVPWEVCYKHPYGEIPNTEGRDGDPVDVYLGPLASGAARVSPATEQSCQFVFIVHQVKKDGRYDEDKCFLGFEGPLEATQCYFEHGPRWGFGSLDTLTFPEFVHGYLSASRKDAKAPQHVIHPRDMF